MTVSVVAALGGAVLVPPGCGGTLEDDYRRRQSPAGTPTTEGGSTIAPMGGTTAPAGPPQGRAS